MALLSPQSKLYRNLYIRDEALADEKAQKTVEFEYFEPFYNRVCEQYSLEYKSPTQFEQNLSPPRWGWVKDEAFTYN
tara:strand:- start:469 stop:699 length:231 start_codon:yes stop_codon:yes gene_type:complete